MAGYHVRSVHSRVLLLVDWIYFTRFGSSVCMFHPCRTDSRFVLLFTYLHACRLLSLVAPYFNIRTELIADSFILKADSRYHALASVSAVTGPQGPVTPRYLTFYSLSFCREKRLARLGLRFTASKFWSCTGAKQNSQATCGSAAGYDLPSTHSLARLVGHVSRQ